MQRAGRILDQMEERGIISGYSAGSKPRQSFNVQKKRWEELKMGTSPEDNQGIDTRGRNLEEKDLFAKFII